MMALAREAAALFEILMEEKNLSGECSGREDAIVEGDRLFLRQALVNVLHNAVKYSPEGGTIPRGGREGASGSERGGFRYGSGDSGGRCGQDLRSLLSRGEVPIAGCGRRGLGLSIAQWAVQAHGGTIVLDQRVEQGCMFRIRIPAGGGLA